MQLLPAKSGASVKRCDSLEVTARQVGAVVIGAASSHHATRVSKQPLDFWCGSWRGGDDSLWVVAQAQAQLKLVKRGLRVSKLGQLIKPTLVALWATQLVRFARIECGANAAIGPGQPALAWLIQRSEIWW